MAAAFSLPLLKNEYLRLPLLLFCLQQQQLLRQRKQSIYIAITTHIHNSQSVSRLLALCPLNECVSLSLRLCVCFQFANCQTAAAAAGRTKKCLGFVSLSPLFLLLQFVVHSATMHKHTHNSVCLLCNSICRGQYSIFIFVVLLYLSRSRTFISSFWVEFVWQHIAEWPSTLEESLFLGTTFFCVFCWRAFHHLDDLRPESWAPSREPRQRQTLQIV